MKSGNIASDEGLQSVEEINEGDWGPARDEQIGEQTYRQVTRTFVRPSKPVRELEFQTNDGSTEKVRVTSEHPFRVKERGWVEAAKLLPGDEVFTSAGGWVRVSNGAWVSQRQTVYNFEVEGFHSYFVGETGVWVHNTSCPLKGWLDDEPELLDETRRWYRDHPEWWSIDPDTTPVFIVPKQRLREYDGLVVKEADIIPMDLRWVVLEAKD